MTDATLEAGTTSHEPDAQQFVQTVLGRTVDGQTIRMTITPSVLKSILAAAQDFLLRSMQLAQRLGGMSLLPVTSADHVDRRGEHILVLVTENLGAVGFQLTPTQWQRVADISAQVVRDGPSVQ